MKKTKYLILMIAAVFALNSCETEPETIDFVSFQGETFEFGVDLASNTSNDIAIYATTTSGSDRSYTIEVVEEGTTADASAYTVPTTVTIPAGTNKGVFTVNIADVNIGEAGKNLILAIKPTNGEYYTGSNITLNITQVCPVNDLKLTITFDDYPEETSWELLDSTGATIASGGEAGAYDGETLFEKKFCLEDGTYTFTIYDVYQDGIGNGTDARGYKLVNGTNSIATGSLFGASDTTTFTLTK
tara:strand:+ start:207000 stop:207731 length:732 start_codon:yes stop_codon:yes gene_type:complete